MINNISFIFGSTIPFWIKYEQNINNTNSFLFFYSYCLLNLEFVYVEAEPRCCMQPGLKLPWVTWQLCSLNDDRFEFPYVTGVSWYFEHTIGRRQSYSERCSAKFLLLSDVFWQWLIFLKAPYVRIDLRNRNSKL